MGVARERWTARSRDRSAVLQGAQSLVGRRQIGRIGETHQHHFGRRNGPVRRLHLGDALEQDLPGTRQGAHGQFLGVFQRRECAPISDRTGSFAASGISLRRVTTCEKVGEIGEDHGWIGAGIVLRAQGPRRPPARRRA